MNRAVSSILSLCTSDLRMFMSNSVAAAISGDKVKADAFWSGVTKLKNEWNMDKSDLCTFMNLSVAAAISGDKSNTFWNGIATLKEEWKLEKADLCRLVSDVRVVFALRGDREKADVFWSQVESLKQVSGMHKTFLTSRSKRNAEAGSQKIRNVTAKTSVACRKRRSNAESRGETKRLKSYDGEDEFTRYKE